VKSEEMRNESRAADWGFFISISGGVMTVRYSCGQATKRFSFPANVLGRNTYDAKIAQVKADMDECVLRTSRSTRITLRALKAKRRGTRTYISPLRGRMGFSAVSTRMGRWSGFFVGKNG